VQVLFVSNHDDAFFMLFYFWHSCTMLIAMSVDDKFAVIFLGAHGMVRINEFSFIYPCIKMNVASIL